MLYGKMGIVTHMTDANLLENSTSHENLVFGQSIVNLNSHLYVNLKLDTLNLIYEGPFTSILCSIVDNVRLNKRIL